MCHKHLYGWVFLEMNNALSPKSHVPASVRLWSSLLMSTQAACGRHRSAVIRQQSVALMRCVPGLQVPHQAQGALRAHLQRHCCPPAVGLQQCRVLRLHGLQWLTWAWLPPQLAYSAQHCTTTAHPSPVHLPQELTPKHACQLSRGLCGVVRSALACYSVVQRVSCRGEPAVDPLTGKSISLLKLSPAEEDIVWVYENFSYSCEWPAFAVLDLGRLLLQGLKDMRQAGTCFQAACHASKRM